MNQLDTLKEEDTNQSEKKRKDSPPEVKNRLKTWLRIWVASIVIHYFFVIGGIICSTMAAAQWPTVNYGRVFAILSGVCVAIIGFVRPEQRYPRCKLLVDERGSSSSRNL